MNFGPLILVSQILCVLMFSAVAYLAAAPVAPWLFSISAVVIGHVVILSARFSESMSRRFRRIGSLCVASVMTIAAFGGFYFLRAECVVWPTTPQRFEPKYVFFPIRLTGPVADQVEKHGSRQAVVDRFQPLSVKRILDKTPNIERERLFTTVALLTVFAIGFLLATVLLQVLTAALLERADILYGARTSTRRYKVALSFAGGKNRPFVEDVAEYLARELGRREVFYDCWLTSLLARTNLHEWLGRVYSTQSDLVVPFLDAEYERREWTRIEWQAIHTLIDAGRHERVMLVRLDNARITGLVPTDGYVEKGDKTAKDIAQLILERFRSLQPVVEEAAR